MKDQKLFLRQICRADHYPKALKMEQEVLASAKQIGFATFRNGYLTYLKRKFFN